MGGEFGTGVSALLETYGKCLSLLKDFKEQHSRPGKDDPATSEAHSQLRKSIRSDRSRVRAAYTARLYRDGKRLSQGDPSSRSKLNRILTRLKGAIVNILEMSKKKKPSIDYASLMALSNTSRVDAIKTMDELSRRLSKPSRSSLSGKKKASSSSSPSTTSSSVSKSKPTQKDKDKDSKKRSSDKRKDEKTKDSDHRQAKTTGKAARNPGGFPTHDASSKHVLQKKEKKEKTKPAENDRVGDLRKPTGSSRRSRGSSAAEATSPSKRFSFLSMSSGSTKLGEIPTRRSRRNPEDGESEYGYRPVYPLHAHKPSGEEKGGFFKRFFGAAEEKSTSRR